jgi:hypothetical protein
MRSIAFRDDQHWDKAVIRRNRSEGRLLPTADIRKKRYHYPRTRKLVVDRFRERLNAAT